MPGRVFCCLCSRRVETNKARVRIGTDSVLPLFQIHIEKIGLDKESFTDTDNICMKCYGVLSHYRMTDRGPNKLTKISKPLDPQLTITKKVLRSASNQESVSGSVTVQENSISNENRTGKRTTKDKQIQPEPVASSDTISFENHDFATHNG